MTRRKIRRVESAKPERQRAWREEKEGASCREYVGQTLPIQAGTEAESAAGESRSEEYGGGERENRLFGFELIMSIGPAEVGDGLLLVLTFSGLDECTSGFQDEPRK